MDTPITRAEHEEFRRSVELANQNLEAENNRQNKRLELLEENVRQMGALTTSVERLAMSVESMVKEQERQGKRLEVLESLPAQKWNHLVKTLVASVATTILGGIVGAVLALILK